MFSLLQVIISTCKSLKGQGISRGFQNNLMYVSWKWKKKSFSEGNAKPFAFRVWLHKCQNHNVGHWTVLFWWFSGSWLALLGIPLNYSFIMYQKKDYNLVFSRGFYFSLNVCSLILFYPSNVHKDNTGKRSHEFVDDRNYWIDAQKQGDLLIILKLPPSQ